MRHLFSVVVLCAMLAGVGAGAPDRPAGWGPLEPLVGDWTGEGSGGPGEGSGSFSFKPDLQGKILVRKNRAEYPATKDRPALVHDDLMVVYREAPGTPLRAIYFDNEGHTIRYEVQGTEDGSQAIFVSAAEPGTARYRLTYTRAGQDRLKIKFEIAPPGKSEQFATYIEAGARRAAR